MDRGHRCHGYCSDGGHDDGFAGRGASAWMNFDKAPDDTRGRPTFMAELNTNSLFVLDLSAGVDNVVALFAGRLGLAG